MQVAFFARPGAEKDWALCWLEDSLVVADFFNVQLKVPFAGLPQFYDYGILRKTIAKKGSRIDNDLPSLEEHFLSNIIAHHLNFRSLLKASYSNPQKFYSWGLQSAGW